MGNLKNEFTKGIIKENPVLRLVLGTCPTLATTTNVVGAFGMGIAAQMAQAAMVAGRTEETVEEEDDEM